MADSIYVSKLAKKYGAFTAVKGISFKVKKGEIFRFLGPNGAGKTTTVHMLTKIIDKTSGQAKVAGFTLSALHKSRNLPLLSITKAPTDFSSP